MPALHCAFALAQVRSEHRKRYCGRLYYLNGTRCTYEHALSSAGGTQNRCVTWLVFVHCDSCSLPQLTKRVSCSGPLPQGFVEPKKKKTQVPASLSLRRIQHIRDHAFFKFSLHNRYAHEISRRTTTRSHFSRTPNASKGVYGPYHCTRNVLKLAASFHQH